MELIKGLIGAIVTLGIFVAIIAIGIAVLQLFSIARSLRRIADVVEGQRFNGRFFARANEE